MLAPGGRRRRIDRLTREDALADDRVERLVEPFGVGQRSEVLGQHRKRRSGLDAPPTVRTRTAGSKRSIVKVQLTYPLISHTPWRVSPYQADRRSLRRGGRFS